MIRIKIAGRTAAQIAASIEQGMRHGTLLPDTPLPTIRELAAKLRVSPVTVAAAYGRLRSRGLAVGDRRRGTRVRATASTVNLQTAPIEAADDMVDLASGNPDPALLPSLEPALRGLEADSPSNGSSMDVRPFTTFAASEFAADGVPAGAVAVVGGARDAIERILREHLKPGDRVGVEDPALPGLLDLLAACGLRAEPFAVDDDGPAPASFEAVLRRVGAVVVTTRAQNPTGSAVSEPRAADLKRILRAHHDAVVVEIDGAGPVAGVPYATLCDGGSASWAVVRSTSPFLGADLRVAAVAGDDVTLARIQGRQALGVGRVSHLLQRLALALWSDPSSGRRLARAAGIYAQRRQGLIDALVHRGIPASGRSGFNVWIPVREETTTVQRLAARGWAVAAGERFRLRTGPAIRVTTSALAVEASQQFADDLELALRRSARVSA
jgi:DNA-binding transcriptional MocR family regulator